MVDKWGAVRERGSYKGLADRALLFCVLLFAAATWGIEHHGPLFGLVFLQSVGAAAIIGGIADWYGVVSIYGRPLGISYRTEIIVAKKVELVAAVRSFVCDDILSHRNIMDKLQNYPLTGRFLELFEDRSGETPFSWLARFGSAILFEVAAKAESDEIAGRIRKVISGSIERVGPSDEIIRIARWSIDSGYFDRLLTALVPGLRRILLNRGFRSVLEEFARSGISRYVGDNPMRNFFLSRLLEKELTDRGALRLEAFFDEVEQSPAHPLRLELKERVSFLIDDLERDALRREKIDRWLREAFQGEAADEYLAAAVANLKNSLFSEQNCRVIVETLLMGVLDRLKRDPAAAAALDRWLLIRISTLVEQNHDRIGAIVDASLNAMDKGELVQFVREGIERDLQLIRVNGMAFGMIIGAIVAGIRLYIL